MNSKGDSEGSFTLVTDGMNEAFSLGNLGYHNSWKIVWNNPMGVESQDWVDIYRCIQVYSKSRDCELCLEDFRFSLRTPKIEIIFCPYSDVGKKNSQNVEGLMNIIAQLSGTDCSISVSSGDQEAQASCNAGKFSLDYVDPFDHSPLTFAKGSELDISYLKKVSLSGVLSTSWVKDINSACLDDNNCSVHPQLQGKPFSRDCHQCRAWDRDSLVWLYILRLPVRLGCSIPEYDGVLHEDSK